MGRSRKDPIPHMGEIEITPPLSRHPTDYRHPPPWTSRFQIIPSPLNILNSFILGLDLKTFGLLNLSIAFYSVAPWTNLHGHISPSLWTS